MQRAVRILRIALPVAFIAFLALIGLSYSSNRIRSRPASAPVSSSIRAGDRPQSVAYLFEDTQTVGGRVLSKIRARRTMGFASGWYTLEDVELTIFRENRSYRLHAPQAQFQIQTKQAEVKKGVRLTSSDGIAVQTEEMKFDGNRLSNEIPLSFSAQNWTGRAGGMDLNLEQETMRLIGGVEGVMQPAVPGEPPLAVKSRSAEFQQGKGEVTFRDEVVLNRAGDILTNEAIMAKLDQTGKVLVGLEGCCKVGIQLRAHSTLVPGGLGEGDSRIEAERFFSEIGPHGEIRAIVALGAPARGLFQGPPRRDLTATGIRIGVAGDRVSNIGAEGNVNLTEQATPDSRVLQANYLTLHVDPATRRISSAVARENMTYRDAKSYATAQHANYDTQNQILVLAAEGQSLPSLTTEGHTLRANLLEFVQRERVLRAKGNVSAQLASRQEGISASDTALFPKQDGPVFVNADALMMRQAERIAVFTGKIRAWQGNNVLFTSTLQLEAGGESLNARDGVRVILHNVRGEKRIKPLVARSQVLVARKNERKVDLEGNVQIEDDPRTLNADRATIFLDAGRRIERLEATANLVVNDRSTDRKATGTHAVYRLTEKTLYLDGSPAVVTEPRGMLKGKQIVFDIAKNKVNVVSGDTPTEATYHPQ